ncbi:MAG TPA: Gx transporter family protein [Clostridiales bacterium]|nr:Gx transporter family protein [Clostridiales bacterium]
MEKKKINRITTYGLLVALAFILSYIENLIPIPVPIPGIKLGMANLVVITALYSLGIKEALSLSILRIILVSFTYGSPSTMLFSLAGGLLSWGIMALFKNGKLFSFVGVSILGGIFHNVGQILTAVFVVENINIVYYLPFLLISGVFTGALIGILGAMILKRLKHLYQ